MRRRAFIELLGGAATWPLVARAQQPGRMRRIGVLMGVADDPEGQARLMALKQGLQELGWIDGRSIQIESRFAGADAGRIRADVTELVALEPRAANPVRCDKSRPVVTAIGRGAYNARVPETCAIKFTRFLYVF